jgi:hypothetical protein
VFENLERYRQRRIRERFPAEELERLGRELGIRCFDPEFYLGRGVLLRNFTQEGYSPGFLSLDEARARVGLG